MSTPPDHKPWRRTDRSESIPLNSSHFVFQIGGNVLLIMSAWVGFFGILALVGTIWSGWQGRAGGIAILLATYAMYRLGRWLALEHRVHGGP